MVISHLHRRSLHSSTDFNLVLVTQPKIPLAFLNRSDLVKEDVYNQCRSVLERSLSLGQLQHNHSNGERFFANLTIPLQDVYLLLRYSPSRDNEDGLYLQIAASYLLSQNLQKLSIQQQMRTRIVIFLNENVTNVMSKRFERWFKSIYEPYTTALHIIRMKDDNDKASLEFMMNYTKHNEDIQLDTILFLLENDYIFESDMLSDTIEFFASHNPCFVYQPDYFDRCRLEINNDNQPITLVSGRTRLWRSILSTTFPYAFRLRTFLAFEDIIMHLENNRRTNHDTRIRVGDTVFFCATPSYGGRIETLRLPNEVNITADDDTSVYYKDWWSMARYAFAEAQKKDSFPAVKINERNLFA